MLLDGKSVQGLSSAQSILYGQRINLVKTVGMANVPSIVGWVGNGQNGQEHCSLYRYAWETFFGIERHEHSGRFVSEM